MTDLAATLAARTQATDAGCVEWTGYRDTSGYGRIMVDRVPRLTHRVAWELAHGPIGEGLHVHHRCGNPPCVNIEHLGVVTAGQHAAEHDGFGGARKWRAKTHCPQGHPYDDENTAWSTRGDGSRFRKCRACERAYTHRRRGPEKATHRGPRRRDAGD